MEAEGHVSKKKASLVLKEKHAEKDHPYAHSSTYQQKEDGESTQRVALTSRRENLSHGI